jgi:hypothetical protein
MIKKCCIELESKEGSNPEMAKQLSKVSHQATKLITNLFRDWFDQNLRDSNISCSLHMESND